MLATINYVAPPEGPVIHFKLDHCWTGAVPDPRQLQVQDGREVNELSLQSHGFQLERLASGVTDYDDAQQLERRFAPAVQDLIKQITGADWVVTWAVNVRFANTSPNATRTLVSAPARAAHSDLGPAFDPARIGTQPLAEQAAATYAKRLGKQQPARWQVFNVWQQISPPPQDTPLAVCQLDSVAVQDIVMGHGTAEGDHPGHFELTFFKHNPDHRWFYFSEMLPGETIIFSGMDPTAGPGLARVPHCAFDLPARPAHAIPRNSIEIRAMAIFDS